MMESQFPRVMESFQIKSTSKFGPMWARWLLSGICSVMFPATGIIPVQRAFSIFHIVYPFCFKYKVPSYRLQVLPNKSLSTQLSLFFLLSNISHTGFQLFRLLGVLQFQQHLDLDLLILDIIWLSGTSLCTLIYSHLILKRAQVAAFVNRFINFEETLERKFNMQYNLTFHTTSEISWKTPL